MYPNPYLPPGNPESDSPSDPRDNLVRSGVVPILLSGFTPQQSADLRMILDAVVQPLRGEVLETLTALRNVRNRLESAEGSITALQQDLAQLRNHIAGLRLSDIQRDLRQVRQDFADLVNNGNPQSNTQLTALTTRVRQLEDTLTGNVPPPPLSEGAEAVPPAVDMPPNLDGTVVDIPSPASEQSPADFTADTPHQKDKPKRKSRKQKRSSRKKKGNSSDTSSEEDEHSSKDDDTHSEESSSSEDSEDDSESEDERGGVFIRKKRPDFRSLKVIRPSNRDYKRPLDYRYYRLAKRQQTREGQATRKAKRHISKLELIFKGRKFDGTDKIKVLAFLAKFAVEADLLRMTEGQAVLAIPEMLRGQASVRYEAANSVNTWPETVQYFLRNYATDAIIEQAVEDLKNIQQKAGEHEVDYSNRLTEAELRCGNVHEWHERKLRYIQGLIPPIKPLVARYNRENRRATYWDVVEFAQSEGDAYRARGSVKRKEPQSSGRQYFPRGSAAPQRRVYLLEGSESSASPLPSTTDDTVEGEGEVHLVSGGSPSVRSPSHGTGTTSPSTVETIDATSSGYTNIRRNQWVNPQNVPFQDRATRAARPGWADYRLTGESTAQLIYCYNCYRAGHISPDCNVDIDKNPQLVVANYEKLSREILRIVPAANYWKARDLIDSRQGLDPNNTALPPRTQEVHPRSMQTTATQGSVEEKKSPRQTQGKG